MENFRKTSHISEIIENSKNQKVIIYKHSNKCNISDIVKKELTENISNKLINFPVYIITVQEMPVLSKNIENLFGIKHETPQVIIIENEKVLYNKNHRDIKIEDIAKI